MLPLLLGCHHSTSTDTRTYSIGGDVVGLGGTGLVLRLNGGDDTVISADGPFAFATELMESVPYEVTAVAQPSMPDQFCMVSQGSGTVDDDDVTNVVVDCVTTQYAVSVIVSGYDTDSMSLKITNNGIDELTIFANGIHSFAPQDDGTAFLVEVSAQPITPGQVCSVSDGAGSLGGVDESIAISCVNESFAVGGNLLGLVAGNAVTLRNDGIYEVFSASGPYLLGAALNDQDNYDVTVFANATSPDQTCTVANGVGTIDAADVTDVDVACATHIVNEGAHSDTEYDPIDDVVQLGAVGLGNGNGDFTSDVLDVGISTAWPKIGWEPGRPYLKELPGNGGVETAYPEGNVDMSSAVLLFHLNEASWSGAPGEIVDSSAQGNNGTAAGDATTDPDGLFGRAGVFDGAGDYLLVPDDPSLDVTTFTIAGWFHFGGDIGSIRLVEKGSGTVPADWSYRLLTLDDGVFGFFDAPFCQITDGTAAVSAFLNNALATYLDEWVFLACTYDGATLKLFINDTLVASTPSALVPKNSALPLGVGADGRGTFPYQGAMDELVVLSTGFSDTEVGDIYRRGALGLRFQVRSCDDAACTGEFFAGPNGTATTHYSELDNASLSLPSIDLFNVPDNRYFQFRAFFESDLSAETPTLSRTTIEVE